MQDMILGVVRHSLTTAGGALVTKGLVTAATLDQAVGALLTLAGLVWSIIEKLKKQP